MGRAEDVVRARQRAARDAEIDDERRTTAAAKNVEDQLRLEILDLIPSVMRLLELQDYPDAELHKVMRVTKSLFLDRRIRWDEFAGWRIYTFPDPLDDAPEHVSSVWLLSDGTIEHFEYLEERRLRGVLDGLHALNRNLGGAPVQ